MWRGCVAAKSDSAICAKIVKHGVFVLLAGKADQTFRPDDLGRERLEKGFKLRTVPAIWKWKLHRSKVVGDEVLIVGVVMVMAMIMNGVVQAA